MKIYELTPDHYDRVKSFYGKAIVIEYRDEIFLQSYNTIVCMIDKSGKFIKLWNGYSITTMRHVNNFARLFNIDGGGKKWWDAIPVKNGGKAHIKNYVGKGY